MWCLVVPCRHVQNYGSRSFASAARVSNRAALFCCGTFSLYQSARVTTLTTIISFLLFGVVCAFPLRFIGMALVVIVAVYRALIVVLAKRLVA